MKLFLMRHGMTESNQESNPGLSLIGVKQLEKVAKGLKIKIVKLDAIFCSPLRRTRESAEIVSHAFFENQDPEILEELKLGEKVSLLINWVENYYRAHPQAEIMLVGHQPELQDLSARLLGGSSSIIFGRGSVAEILLSGEMKAVLGWCYSAGELAV